MSNVPFARQMKMCRCPLCNLVCEKVIYPADQSSCPRCHTSLLTKRSGRLQISWALLIAALICYIPANLLPVMYTNMFGNGNESTILSGVIEFWNSGSWGIAIIIFIASVVIPCMKFLSIGMLLITVGRNSSWARRERTRLWRMTEWIGCWSMLDVVVVGVVSGLVKFHNLSEAEPRAGILFFGMVVFFTMLSALSFDPKAIWEGK